MQIVHFVTQYIPHIGGTEIVVKELAERAAKKGHDVTVITSNMEGCKAHETINNVEIYRLRAIRRRSNPIFLPGLPLKLLKLLKRNTVVHVHYIFDYLTDITVDMVLLIAKMKGCRIIANVHSDLPLISKLKRFNPAYKRLMWKYLLPLYDHVICTTQDYIDTACSNGMPINKCALIPLGVDTSRFRYKDSTNIVPPIKVLFVGRLTLPKNIPRLLEAFNLFHASYPSSVLHIVGDGEERPVIEAFIKNNNIPDVIMEGELLGENLINIYTESDIFVLPSDIESFGMVNLEAMASGLPIIASDIPGLRGLLADTAILVKPSAENFASAMKKLVEDTSLRRSMIKKGLEKVKDYDWNKIICKVIALYRKEGVS
jgi:glycosyltransferase involved in cell wall biosynthesis